MQLWHARMQARADEALENIALSIESARRCLHSYPLPCGRPPPAQSHPELDKEKLKKRAERFGVASEEVEEERKAKRAARFGIEVGGPPVVLVEPLLPVIAIKV